MILRILILALCALLGCSCVATGDFSIHDPISGLSVTVGKNPIGSK